MDAAKGGFSVHANDDELTTQRICVLTNGLQSVQENLWNGVYDGRCLCSIEFNARNPDRVPPSEPLSRGRPNHGP